MRRALYFGCWDRAGHYLHERGGLTIADRRAAALPWRDALLDGGLLENAGLPEPPDGRVFWTCGGRAVLWHAFCWWDRSVDHRGKSNSGFYVRGFGLDQPHQAFAYAGSVFPHVVARQKFPLVLQGAASPSLRRHRPLHAASTAPP